MIICRGTARCALKCRLYHGLGTPSPYKPSGFYDNLAANAFNLAPASPRIG
jgi:hypothetical protein